MDKRVIRAKVQLMLLKPFFGSLVVRLKLTDWKKPLFATDGTHIFVPPDANKYKDDELETILAHEVLHCALLHPFRMSNRIHQKWNYACDYAINLLLSQQHFQMPKDCLLDKKYQGMSAEKIYDLLPDMPSITMDLIAGASEKERSELEQEWKERVTAAAQKCRGDMPGGFEEYINEILFPKIPWQEVLYKFLTVSKGCSDYTAYPFDRRHIWRETYLPSMTGESIEICMALDTSGSISHEQLVEDLSEIRGICRIFGDYILHVFQSDAQVHKYDVISEESDVPKIVVGRGGTSFVPVFEKIKELELQGLPLVYFTDLDGEFPSEKRDEVFWVVRKEDKKAVPFGQIVEKL